MSAQIDQTNSRVADLKGQLEVTTQKLGFTQAELAQARALAQNIRESQKESDDKLTAQIGQVKQDADTKIGAGEHGSDRREKRHQRDQAGFGSDQGETHQHGRRPGRAERLDRAQSGGTRTTEATPANAIFSKCISRKSKTPTRVGPIQVTLTKTDPEEIQIHHDGHRRR